MAEPSSLVANEGGGLEGASASNQRIRVLRGPGMGRGHGRCGGTLAVSWSGGSRRLQGQRASRHQAIVERQQYSKAADIANAMDAVEVRDNVNGCGALEVANDSS